MPETLSATQFNALGVRDKLRLLESRRAAERQYTLEIPKGTDIEVVLVKHGERLTLWAGGEKISTVGKIKIEEPIQAVIEVSESGSRELAYLRPRSAQAEHEKRKFGDAWSMSRAQEIAFETAIDTVDTHHMEAELLKANPQLAELMKRNGQTTAGFDILFRFEGPR